MRLIGPKGVLDHVAVLGPARSATQVEISATDARFLGVKAPVRLSGELQDAAEIILQTELGILVRKAAIIARRHLHMTPADAEFFHVSNGQCVSVRVMGSRPLSLEEVPIRVSEQAALALHMDTDEANAAGVGKDCQCRITGLCSSVSQSPCSSPDASGNAAVSHAPTEHESCSSFPGKLITEYDIRQLCASGVRTLCVAKGQIITPLARDTAKACGMSLTYGG